ncbi:MAG TPA: hypothetical protein VFS02_06495 [Telluria sp.]|nr:hypothetical protein [Telluria sp.]
MNNTNILLAALLATLIAPSFAAEAEADPAQQARVVTREAIEIRTRDGNPMIGPMMRMHGKAVKNAPYSAEVINERQQNLADGNQITNKSTSFSYRDSAGRTRQEMRDARGEVLTVSIHDAADGTTYVLSPRSKTAHKIGPNKEIGKAAAEMARARIEQLRKEGRLPEGERREIIVRRFAGVEADAQARAAEGAALHLEAPLMGALPNGRELALHLAPLTGAMADMKWARKAATKDLGTREIEGIKAEGKLRSYEIPAGEMGNRNAITVSDESWYSPELQVTLLTKHSDPRTGESTYRLTNIHREEPAAALFAVPSDYTVKDVMANVVRNLEKKAP